MNKKQNLIKLHLITGETVETVEEVISHERSDIISHYDLVMITCAHTNVDYTMIQKYAKAIFDTKNVMKNIEDRSNIEVL